MTQPSRDAEAMVTKKLTHSTQCYMASTPKSSATFQRLDFLPGLLASWVTILVFTYKIFKDRSTKKIKHVLKSVEVTESISFSTKFYIFETVIIFSKIVEK